MRASLLGLDEPEYVTETGHRIWGGMPIELEMAELLYGIVRYAKPEVVIESGTGSGRSTQAISAALVHNGKGVVYSYETVEEFRLLALAAFTGRENVFIRDGFSRKAEEVPDLVFVDTGGGPEQREPEITHWLEHESKPLVVVHDGARAYESFAIGDGVTIFGNDGVWVGRGRGG